MTEKQYEHNSFVLYKDSRIFINRLSKCQRGELLLAIFDYVCDGLVPDFEDDVMLQMCFDIIRSYLDRDEKKYQERCRKNKENIEKRWNKSDRQSNTNVYGSKQSNTNCTDKDTDKDTDTDRDMDTVSDTDTETDTKQADADFDSVGRQAASAAAEAEPPAGDLFSIKQLEAIAKRNKITLTEDGIQIFYEEMRESGWVLFRKPVKKSGIVKAMRGWAKFHPEYALDLEVSEPEEDVIEPIKIDLNDTEAVDRWLKEEYGDEVI